MIEQIEQDTQQQAIKALLVAMESVENCQKLAGMNAEDRRLLSVIHSQLGRLYRQQMKASGHPDFQCF